MFFRAHLMALIRNDADGMTIDSRIRCHERLAIVGFVFVERIGIDDRGEKIARIVGFLSIKTNEIVKRLRIFRWSSRLVFRRRFRNLRLLGFGQKRDERTEPLQTGWIIFLVEIHRAADLRVHVRAAEFLGIDDLSDGRFDQ